MTTVVTVMVVRERRVRDRTAERQIDWTFIGVEFSRMGITRKQVSNALSVPRTTVDNWFAYGMEPRYSEGYLCIVLYKHLRFGEALPDGLRFPGMLPKVKSREVVTG